LLIQNENSIKRLKGAVAASPHRQGRIPKLLSNDSNKAKDGEENKHFEATNNRIENLHLNDLSKPCFLLAN
jgi:hypothetical protein